MGTMALMSPDCGIHRTGRRYERKGGSSLLLRIRMAGICYADWLPGTMMALVSATRTAEDIEIYTAASGTDSGGTDHWNQYFLPNLWLRNSYRYGK